MCWLVELANRESRIGGHGFDLGVSQSGERKRTTDGRRTDCHISRLPGSESGIPLPGFGDLGSTPPIQKSACTPNKLQTLVSHKHTSKASDIAFHCKGLVRVKLLQVDPEFEGGDARIHGLLEAS